MCILFVRLKSYYFSLHIIQELELFQTCPKILAIIKLFHSIQHPRILYLDCMSYHMLHANIILGVMCFLMKLDLIKTAIETFGFLHLLDLGALTIVLEIFP